MVFGPMSGELDEAPHAQPRRLSSSSGSLDTRLATTTSNDSGYTNSVHQLSQSSSSSLASSMRSGRSTSSTAQQQSQEEDDEDPDPIGAGADQQQQVNNNNNNNKDCNTTSSNSNNSNNSNSNNSNNSNNNNNNNKRISTKLKRYLSMPRRSSTMAMASKLAQDEFTQRLLADNRRQIQITTCGEIYNRWRQSKRLYHKAPANGIQLEVDYIDTGLTLMEHMRERVPVVLALHGAPGSYYDFSLLIQHLAGHSVRVIAPNFPEYTATVRTKTLFRHSADEKAAYLRDFLRAINVNRIDLLVSHSSAVFPSLLILLQDNPNYEFLDDATTKDGDGDQQQQQDEANPKRSKRPNANNMDTVVKNQATFHIEIRALALFNPAGHRLPQSMKPTWFKCGSVRIYQNKLGRSLFQKFGSGFLTIVGVPVRVDNMDHVMLSATVMRNSECQRLVRQLNYLSQLKLPTLLVFSENDKLIEKDIFYEMTQFMGLNRNHFDIFNHQGEIELAQSSKDHWIRVMVFKAGGHYAYSNYATTVNKAVTELLCKVCSCSNGVKSHQEGLDSDRDEKQGLKMMLENGQQRHPQQQVQQPPNSQKVTLVDNRFMPGQVKRHFKW